MSETTATASTHISAPLKKVWEALIDPEAIREYSLGATVSTDWKVGSPITWSGEWKGNPYEDKGEILAFEPMKKLSFSHWSSMGGSDDTPENHHVVTITLSEADGRTEVTLAQSNLTGGVTDRDREHRAEYEENWSTMLRGLKRIVES